MSIPLGSWAIPLGLSFLLLGGWALWAYRQPSTQGLGSVADAVVSLVALLGAIILVLVTWLTWAVLT